MTIKIYPLLDVKVANIICYDQSDNEFILNRVVGSYGCSNVTVVEGIACYGHKIGNDIINTAYAIGRFRERWEATTGYPEKFGIFTSPEVRACVLGRARGQAKELKDKVKWMWSAILPLELSKDKNRHVISALSVVTCYIIKNIGIRFFE